MTLLEWYNKYNCTIYHHFDNKGAHIYIRQDDPGFAELKNLMDFDYKKYSLGAAWLVPKASGEKHCWRMGHDRHDSERVGEQA